MKWIFLLFIALIRCRWMCRRYLESLVGFDWVLSIFVFCDFWRKWEESKEIELELIWELEEEQEGLYCCCWVDLQWRIQVCVRFRPKFPFLDFVLLLFCLCCFCLLLDCCCHWLMWMLHLASVVIVECDVSKREGDGRVEIVVGVVEAAAVVWSRRGVGVCSCCCGLCCKEGFAARKPSEELLMSKPGEEASVLLLPGEPS